MVAFSLQSFTLTTSTHVSEKKEEQAKGNCSFFTVHVIKRTFQHTESRAASLKYQSAFYGFTAAAVTAE